MREEADVNKSWLKPHLHNLGKVSQFYSNPLTFEGYRNNRIFPIQILVFRRLLISADGHISILGHIFEYHI